MKICSMNVRIALAERQMSQAELAKACGIASQNLSAILAKGRCSTVTAGRIASALGIKVREIVDKEEP